MANKKETKGSGLVESVLGEEGTDQIGEKENPSQTSKTETQTGTPGDGGAAKQEDTALDKKREDEAPESERMDSPKFQDIAMKGFSSCAADTLYFTSDGNGFIDKILAENHAAILVDKTVSIVKKKQEN